MIRDIVAVGLTGAVILISWVFVKYARKGTFGRFDVTALVLLLLPSALMCARRFGEERAPLTIFACAVAGSILMLVGRGGDAE